MKAFLSDGRLLDCSDPVVAEKVQPGKRDVLLILSDHFTDDDECIQGLRTDYNVGRLLRSEVAFHPTWALAFLCRKSAQDERQELIARAELAIQDGKSFQEWVAQEKERSA